MASGTLLCIHMSQPWPLQTEMFCAARSPSPDSECCRRLGWGLFMPFPQSPAQKCQAHSDLVHPLSVASEDTSVGCRGPSPGPQSWFGVGPGERGADRPAGGPCNHGSWGFQPWAEAGRESPCDILFQMGRLRLGEAGSLLCASLIPGGATAAGRRALVSSGVQGAEPP